MTPIGHRKAVDLRFDADDGDSISLEPFYIDLVSKVSNAREVGKSRQQFKHFEKSTNLHTMASSGMVSKSAPVMTSLLLVVVTKILPRGAASSIVVTS